MFMQRLNTRQFVAIVTQNHVISELLYHHYITCYFYIKIYITKSKPYNRGLLRLNTFKLKATARRYV
jgi:hypothetical protein